MRGDVNKLFVFQSLLTTPSNILPLHLKQTFPTIVSHFPTHNLNFHWRWRWWDQFQTTFYNFFLKEAWIQSHHLHLQWKFKLWVGKFALGVKAKHCWALSTKFWKQKVCWHHPVMFCLITSSKLSIRPLEFSLKVKVMGSNPGYLLKLFLLAC